MTKLYEIPRLSVLVIAEGETDTELMFHHIDGMYSYCTARGGQDVVHLAATTCVVLLDDGRYQVLL